MRDCPERPGRGGSVWALARRAALPFPAAQLRFALAEVRKSAIGAHRVRARHARLSRQDRGALSGPPRCAARVFGRDALGRPALGGDERITASAEMYRALHHDLVQIPPTDQAKTDKQRQLFFAMSNALTRVLLEKGLEMMKRTTAFASKEPRRRAVGKARRDRSRGYGASTRRREGHLCYLSVHGRRGPRRRSRSREESSRASSGRATDAPLSRREERGGHRLTSSVPRATRLPPFRSSVRAPTLT